MISRERINYINSLSKKMSNEEIASELNVSEASVVRYLRLVNEIAIPEKKKVLIFDIETSPSIGFFWNAWKTNIPQQQVVYNWYMISWSAKFLGEDSIYSGVLTPSEAVAKDDNRIIGELWDLFNESDLVMAHNGDKFDIPRLKTRLIVNGYNMPSSFKSIDTLKIARNNFGFLHNNLDALCKAFGLETKHSTSFDLWKRCYEGEQEALNEMSTYNNQDVVILEQLYFKLRPFIPNHPSIYDTEGGEYCPVCGSKDIVENGEYTAIVNTYKEYRCEECGSRLRQRSINNPSLISINN